MAKLYFRYGAMGSGKTAALLQLAYNYEQRGMSVFIIKPSIDTKGNTSITSRIGLSRQVDAVIEPESSIKDILETVFPQAIVVDEVQFLSPQQIDEIYAISKVRDIPVLCYGLRCDFQMRGFPGATRLLEIADDIEELKTICECGSKATQNLRKIGGVPVFEGQQVEIDGASQIEYESVCGKCYLLKRGDIK